jgi:NAD-dependent deacetylase
MNCQKAFKLSFVLEADEVPKCDACGGIVKPDVVLYEEALNGNVLEAAVDYIKKADVLIVGGTSLSVYPASGLVSYYNGNKLVLINKTQTSYDAKANLILRDSIGEVFAKVCMQ